MTTVARLLRAAVRIDRPSLQLTRGLRYAAGVGAPLLVGVAVNRLTEGVAVSTGALLVGLTDSGAPYRRRVSAMLVASPVVAVATFVGELVGAHDVLTVVILAVASFVAGLCERVAVAKLYRSVAGWLTRGRLVDDRAPVFLAVAHARDVLDDDARAISPCTR